VKKICVFFFLSLSFSITAPLSISADTRPKVLLISAINADGVLPFWQKTELMSGCAAADLGINLEIKRASNRFESARIAIETINSEEKPDYLVTFFRIGTSFSILEEAQKQDVKVVMINTDIPHHEAERIGTPRSKFINWIGHLLPDDESAGFKLAGSLIDQSMQMNAADKNHVPMIIGLSGGFDSSAALLRNQGLKRAVGESEKAVLAQNTPIHDWSRKQAYEVGMGLLKRYPKANIIWCASQVIAAGAIDAVKACGKIPGKEVLVGGVGWSGETIDMVADGSMSAAVGGHFMEGAWAIVLIYDFHNGIDLVQKTIKTNFDVIVPGIDIDIYQKIGKGGCPQIDFSAFSKKASNVTSYDFSFSKILKNMDR
jgi:ABC-type sugar transport system substrate-binding protein